MEKVFLQIALIFGLLRLQSNMWQSKLRYEIRFILCGIFSYISFEIIKKLGELFAGEANNVIALVFNNPRNVFAVLLTICIGYFGLYCSIIAAALFASLIPKT
jgi:hypothetical protein